MLRRGLTLIEYVPSAFVVVAAPVADQDFAPYGFDSSVIAAPGIFVVPRVSLPLIVALWP